MTKKNITKCIIDIIMSVILLFVMAYQVTNSLYHEWLGAGMLVLFIIHNLLNIKWYGSLFKGRYSVKRVLWTLINIAVLIAILLTVYSGMAMSRNLFSFLNLSTGSASARVIHLLACYWSFVLMSCHLGIHWGMMIAAVDKKSKEKCCFLVDYALNCTDSCDLWCGQILSAGHLLLYVPQKSVCIS